MNIKDISSRRLEIANNERVFKCDTYQLIDNNDGGDWKVPSAAYAALLESGNWGLVIGQYDLHHPLPKDMLEYDRDRIGRPLVPWAMRNLVGGMFPHREMAKADYYALTGEYIADEGRGPSIDLVYKPHVFIKVKSVEDFLEKLKFIMESQSNKKIVDFEDLVIPLDVAHHIEFLTLTKPT